jgi:hypothetical protein
MRGRDGGVSGETLSLPRIARELLQGPQIISASPSSRIRTGEKKGSQTIGLTSS